MIFHLFACGGDVAQLRGLELTGSRGSNMTGSESTDIPSAADKAEAVASELFSRLSMAHESLMLAAPTENVNFTLAAVMVSETVVLETPSADAMALVRTCALASS